MASARERLEVAQVIASDFPSGATGAAYYAMLFAARAALSEEERYAKTHSGTWNLFREVFVASGHFDSELVNAARQAQQLREAADYDARVISREEADAALADAERFVSAVASMFEAS
jgi:uncharacterized protein (UPF0332 family)